MSDKIAKKEASTSSKHNFLGKLVQPSVLPILRDYIRWQAEVRQNPDEDSASRDVSMPNQSPISVNLDPTSACNYSCPHCVDMDILNTGVQYDFKMLRESLSLMKGRGLRSVIAIGGGEPTLYREFEELVKFIKGEGMQMAVVTNGTGMDKINNVGHLFGERDWVRLSLDSASEEKFKGMHKPKGRMTPLYEPNAKAPITLDTICKSVSMVRENHPDLSIGFSYIVTWPGARTNDQAIESNVDEIAATARLAKEHGFSYLSLKAFLDRDPERAHGEVIGLDRGNEGYERIVESIKMNMGLAKELEDGSFKVLVSTNLSALLEGVDDTYKHQPVECHMTNFRQVLGIRGIAICPAYRGEPSANIGEMDAYHGPDNFDRTREVTGRKIRTFNAQETCKNVVCMYQPTNWHIERLIEREISNPRSVNEIRAGPELNDYFL
jgi:MoaA/NifB/PqqE/SkfB family radical SAM enzyme